MNLWFEPPPPQTHYMSPASLREGESVCHYMVEPFECAQQDFTNDPAGATCVLCRDWVDRRLVNDAELRLGKER